MKKNIVSFYIMVTIILAGCNSGANQDDLTNVTQEQIVVDKHNHSESEGHNHESEELKEEGGHEDEIVFTKEQAKAVGLTIETVTTMAFSQVIKTSGQIQSSQGDEATVVATSNGILSFVNSSISEGSAVRAGEAIVTVSAKYIQDGDPAVKAKIEYETAQREFQRAEGLVKDQIISAKEFEQIRRRYETSKSVYDAQAASLSASGVRVTSPINGFIKSRLVSQGEYVSVGQPIVTVSQNKRLQLRAEVSENYYKNLKSISSANFKPSYDNTVYKLSDLNGRLLSFGKASGESSFIPVIFEFDNVGDIIPGSFTEVFLLSTPKSNVISVPVSSITEEQGLFFVYIQLDEEGYKKQEVTLGQNNGERFQILSGLKVGDKVVTNGVYQVKLAAISSVMPEGHNH